MPHDWNNKLVVTKDELVPAFFTSDTLRATIDRYKEKPYGIKRVQKGGNGRQMLIDFDTLPKETQEALGDPRKCDHILERFYKVEGDAVSYFSTYKFEDNTYLDAEFQERYITNANVLRAVIRLREARITERSTKGGSLVGITSTLCSDAHSFQKTLLAKHKVQHTLPENDRCFKATLKDFETLGFESLISKKHKNQNTRKVTDHTLNLLNSLFAGRKHKPTATEVHREYDAFLQGYIEVINNLTGEVFNPADFKKLSDATVKNYMAAWGNKIGTWAIRSSDRQKLMGQFKPYHSLDKPKYASSIISIDDRQPPFKALNGKRVWFYNGIDLGSEAFICWVYGDTKEGIIMEFYRQLVRNFAAWNLPLPAQLECEMSLNSSFQTTFLREGAMFEHVRIEANNARGKRIERYFGNLRYGVEKEREGWLARPFALSESNQPKVAIEQVKQLPFTTIVENGLKDIENWNNQPHSIHTHMSRWQVFMEMQFPNLKPTNYIAIMPHIGFKTETSCNVGIIRLRYQEYLLGNDGKISLGDRLISLMKQVEGQKVTVYWIDDDNGKIFKALVFIGTQYICEAIPKPTYNRAKVEQGPDDELNYKLMSAYVATIESFGRRRKQSIEPVTVLDNRPALEKTFVIAGLNKLKSLREEDDQLLVTRPEEDEFDAIPERVMQPKSLKDRF